MEKITELLIEINKKLEMQEDNTIFTRDEAQRYYKLSKREVDKIFNTILKDKVVDIGKCQRLAKIHIDNMFKNGVVQKYV